MAENSTSGADRGDSGDFSRELAPVVQVVTAELINEPTSPAIVDELALGDLLSDALFGEVIDISDLIPRLAPEVGANVPAGVAMDLTTTAEAGAGDGGELLVASGHAAALTILYDEDILASVSEISYDLPGGR